MPSIVIAYPLIWSIYGYWLPNDPRGSTSKTLHMTTGVPLRSILIKVGGVTEAGGKRASNRGNPRPSSFDRVRLVSTLPHGAILGVPDRGYKIQLRRRHPFNQLHAPNRLGECSRSIFQQPVGKFRIVSKRVPPAPEHEPNQNLGLEQTRYLK